MPLLSPLVGSFAKRGAELILEHLPAGCPLLLDPEPDNPYDANAIRVLVSASSIPESERPALSEELPNFGLSLEELLASGIPVPDKEYPGPVVWLGFIAASGGKPLAKARSGLVGNSEVLSLLAAGPASAILRFGPSGEPEVEVSAARWRPAHEDNNP